MSRAEPAPLARSLAARAAALLRVRWIVRAPIAVYRARLGFVFGSRLLMLEHTGRKTGTRRYVVLEIIDQPRPGHYIVASGFGTQAQWFRNVRASPLVRVWIGGRPPEPATARPLGSDETAAALTAYAARHPRAWAALKPVFEATLGARIDSLHTSLPMIALDLTAGHAPAAGIRGG
jgi:deazaflavin-dependent oxidoreductase (nitroreductase family)